MGRFHPVIFLIFSFYILKYSFYACLRNKCKLLESKLQGDFHSTSVWLHCAQVGTAMGVRKGETRRGGEGGSSTRSKISSLEGGRGRFGPNWKDLLEMWQQLSSLGRQTGFTSKILSIHSLVHSFSR